MEPNIGEIPNAKYRDAIHIAVIAMTAGERLEPGMPVDATGMMAMSADFSVGIVDPFLQEPFIPKDTAFWLFIKPNTVTGMKHQWEHPAFSNYADPEAVSQRWLEGRCILSGVSWHQLKEVYLYGEYIHMGDNMDSYDVARGDEFKQHFKNVFGEDPSDKGGFSCAC